MPNTDLNTAFANAALAVVGVPWVHQGRHREHGLDCIGLVTTSARLAGMAVWDDTEYGRRGDHGKLRKWLSDHALPVLDFKDRRTGDILVFGIDDEPYHLGVLIEEPGKRAEVLHCHQRRLTGDYGGSVERVPFDGLLVKRFIALFRLKSKDS